LLFYPIFWQNGSKHHRQKQQNLGCKTFGIWDPKGPKLGKKKRFGGAMPAWLKFCHASKHQMPKI
jgi:hypothetical protein